MEKKVQGGYHFNGRRLMTRDIANTMTRALQMKLWYMIDKKERETELDYLQIFKLISLEDGSIQIIHSQEVPPYEEKEIFTYAGEDFSALHGKKIYVIDDVEYCTMMYSYEY